MPTLNSPLQLEPPEGPILRMIPGIGPGSDSAFHLTCVIEGG